MPLALGKYPHKWYTKDQIKSAILLTQAWWVKASPLQFYPRFNERLSQEALSERERETIAAKRVVVVWLCIKFSNPDQALNMRPPLPETLLKNGT